jgi:predicted transcriptional regulator
MDQLGAMSRDLDVAGFTVAGAVNAAVEIGQLELTVIYYDASNRSSSPRG